MNNETEQVNFLREEIHKATDRIAEVSRNSLYWQNEANLFRASVADLEARAEKAEARVAELEAALREAQPLAVAWVAHWAFSPAYGNGYAAPIHTAALKQIEQALARATTTPAKHPDTVRLDWLDSTKECTAFCDADDGTQYYEATGYAHALLGVGRNIREVLDNAMKQGGEK